MKIATSVFLLLLTAGFGTFANESINPTVSPSLFQPNTSITVTYDVTGTPLAALTDAYIWVWIPGKNTNAKYNVNPANTDSGKTNNAKFTKSVVDGKTLFAITFTPSAFFDADISQEAQLGMLLKGNDWTNGQTIDYLAPFWDGSFQISLTSPLEEPLFVSDGEDILITAETPVIADFSLYINNILVDEQADANTFSYTHSVSASAGNGTVKLVAASGSNTNEKIFQYILSASSPEVARPSEIIPGINYHADQSKVTLCLWAPEKQSAYVIGDFTNWRVLPEYLMKRSGEYFWLEITGLTPEQEYAFQYLVNESVYIADPFADKILDPDDQYIPGLVYPGLKDFPEAALKNSWYFNRLSVLQTGQQPFDWEVTAFEKPAKENLVIYELLIRDFFANGQRSYSNLTDTISYFKKLGVNAIELMPIMEFNGNESWGYNPTFVFAPDKYYGDKNAFKHFVDECHKNGIAVILDIALNHQDIPNSFLMIDFDFNTMKPEPDNKWFNVNPTHPFNVFSDMNHESVYTKKYIDTINYHWLNEYKVDGFRFDLSKGFTQVNNPDNVDAWSAYDPSRIAIIKRMVDRIWDHTPDALIILEHLAVNQEEKELATYRANEGKGIMLWGKMTDQYNQSTMGYSENSNISGIYHGSRGWDVPHLVGYMESHDEERLMYKNILYGNAAGSYTVKDTLTGLIRQRAANVMFYTVPGPKMLWQFGELGYDYSINYCQDGTNNPDCRVAPKPVRWDYRNDSDRNALLQFTSELIALRNQYDVFTNGIAEISIDNSLTKQIKITNDPYVENPSSADEMNVVVAANFDVIAKDVVVSFPHTGTWYDYYRNGESLEVTGANSTMEIGPGGYTLFTDFPIEASVVTHTENVQENNVLSVYPNPTISGFSIAGSHEVVDMVMYSAQGVPYSPVRISRHSWDVSHLPPGMFIVEVRTSEGFHRTKIIKL